MASLFLPGWATECWTRRTGEAPPEDQPFALVVDGPHGQIVHAVTGAARAASIRVGQRVTDARAICPQLLLEPHDEAATAHTLARLATWCGRWSPLVAVDGADGLLLDLTGAAHLWGGEGAALRTMLDDLSALGHAAQIAIAPSVGAAWGLARYGGARGIRVDADLDDRLAPLPVEALRLDRDTVVLLGRLGLKTIGALCAVPRVPLARRFTASDPLRNPLIRLEQARGRLPEPILPHLAEPPARALRRVVEPIVDLALLETLLGDLAADLVRLLELRGHGLRRARFDAFRVDGGTQCAEVETARPTRDAAHLVRLFDGRFDAFDAGFGFDAFALSAVMAEPLGAAQPGLGGEEPGEQQIARMLDRLVAKLGPGRVRRPVPVASHIPERAVRWVGALEPAEPFTADAAQRPLRLLDRPERIEVLYATPEGAPRRFIWRRRAHPIARVEGPERIATEWWRARPGARTRDYYRVEDEAGRRYWLFRHGRWGDGSDADPAWFLHGLFA